MANLPLTFKLQEEPDVSRIDALLKNTIIYANDRARLFKYRQRIYKKAVNVTYKRKTFNGRPYGRYYPSPGYALTATFQWRKIRATLFADTHCDIDIISCHAVLLSQLYTKEFHKPTPALTHYIQHRDEIISAFDIPQEVIDRHNKNKDDCLTKRDFVKTLFTIVMYGGGLSTFEREFGLTREEYKLPTFFTDFYNEVRTIGAEILASNNPRIAQFVADYEENCDKNKYKSMLSWILQDIEAQVVLCAMEEFKKLTRARIVAYTFDGFMCKKVHNIDAICADLSTIVSITSGYNVTFISKPFESPLVPPQHQLPFILDSKNTLSREKFDDIEIKQMDDLALSAFAYIMVGSIWAIKDVDDGVTEFQIVPSHSLRSALMHLTKIKPAKRVKRERGRPAANAVEEIEEVEITLHLIDNVERLRPLITFDRLRFVPYLRAEEVPSKSLNLFTGYMHNFNENFIVNLELIEPILNHIRAIWCADDTDSYNYIIGWFAHIIQRPRVKMGTAILLKSSKQGAGKNILCNFIMKKVIGCAYTTTLSNSDQVFNKFNATMSNKLLTVLDEIAECGLFLKLTDRLKSIITQEEIHIEKKGLDAYVLDDYNNYIFLTNNTMPVKIEVSDRRYFTLEVSNKYAKDDVYFRGLGAAMTDECGLHLFHYLALMDISNFVPNKIPTTELKMELKINSLTTPLLFLFDVSHEQYYCREIRDMDDPKFIKIHPAGLFDAFISWACSKRIVHKFNAITFGREINKLIKTARYYVDGVRQTGYNLCVEELKNICDEYLNPKSR